MNDKVSRLTDYILRGIFGLVFMFSGFVKAVDPMGTAYKVEEYLNVFGFGFMLNDALTIPIIIAVLLCVLEFALGVMMFLHIYNKPIRWVALAFMLFFTITNLNMRIRNFIGTRKTNICLTIDKHKYQNKNSSKKTKIFFRFFHEISPTNFRFFC